MHIKIFCTALFVMENRRNICLRGVVKVKAYLCSKVLRGYFKCQLQRFFDI